MKKEEILKKGSVEVHAKVSGIRKLFTFKVKPQETAWGSVPYLVCEHRIPAVELLRLAEELQLPIKCSGMTVYPKGKAAEDFAIKKEEESEEEGGAEEEPEPEEKKKEKKPRKKGLSHDVITRGEEGGEKEKGKEKEEGADENAAEKEEAAEGENETEKAKDEPEEEKDKSAAEEKPEEKKESAPALEFSEEVRQPVPSPATEGEQTIEIEGSQPAAQDTKNGGQPAAREEESKERKKVFGNNGVLSEGIQH